MQKKDIKNNSIQMQRLRTLKAFFIDFQIQLLLTCISLTWPTTLICKDLNLLKPPLHNHNTKKSKTRIDFFQLSKTLYSHTVISLKIYNILGHTITSYTANKFQNKFYI